MTPAQQLLLITGRFNGSKHHKQEPHRPVGTLPPHLPHTVGGVKRKMPPHSSMEQRARALIGGPVELAVAMWCRYKEKREHMRQLEQKLIS